MFSKFVIFSIGIVSFDKMSVYGINTAQLNTSGVSNSFSPGGHISLVVAFKRLNVILGLYKCNHSLTRDKELVLLPGRNEVLGWMKQGGGPESAHGPCVCHLCNML